MTFIDQIRFLISQNLHTEENIQKTVALFCHFHYDAIKLTFYGQFFTNVWHLTFKDIFSSSNITIRTGTSKKSALYILHVTYAMSVQQQYCYSQCNNSIQFGFIWRKKRRKKIKFHMSHVGCHISHVTCHMSHVTCQCKSHI